MISESKHLVSRKSLLFLILALCCASAAWAGQWTALGPDGGDVRSLTYDPQNPDHIFLGTSTGSLFTSTDGGHSWTKFAHLGNGDDYVIDHLAIDPQSPNKMYAAAWSVENQQAGDLFRSNDGGTTWETTPAMHGKSIRAMAISASDSKTLVAGALDGVFRSTDGGKNWQKISSSNQEIHNIESIAVDPKNPNVVYAGTWHLAWKTDDGGANWHHINKGMIEDSDVFSIIVDSTNPSVVFASACSGIYKSQTAGDSFQKIQGIPFSARRTRVLKQDPSNASIVYAGTTEGLWKTTDAGKTWVRVSNPDVVVNDVMVDPRNSARVMLATDRAGVLASEDGGAQLRYFESWLHASLRNFDPRRQERFQYHLRGRGKRPRTGRSLRFARCWTALAAEEQRPRRPRCVHLEASQQWRARSRNQSRHVHPGAQCHRVESD